MTDPFTIASITILITRHAPAWLDALRGTILNQGKELAIEKGKDLITSKGTEVFRKTFHLDEKEQQHHLEQALKNSVERGLARFKTPEEQEQYRHVLKVLFESGTHSDTFRREALRLLTISENPDLTALNETYNRLFLASPNSPTTSSTSSTNIDATPYLSSFFDALIVELYNDDFFKPQMSDILKIRAANNAQRSLTEIVGTLRQISDTLTDNYTPEQFAQDVAAYTEHMERNLHHLKIAGVVPKDLGERNADPELNGIFVPLRITPQDQELSKEDKEKDSSIIALLEKYPYLVLLGGPGSGKSTAVRHLAWSHAAANLSVAQSSPLLPGNTLPLRIELRRLTEERRHHSEYSFLSYVIDAQLKRDNITINPQMFEELLKRKIMLLLFDGLDEVATLDERRQLVEEIEHFAMHYPGNRIIVTSRPVGYEFARFSHQWFAHAEVQNFDDEQIRQFLENWYKYVLRLSPLPHDDQQELEALFATLKDNQRLHKLAENPLLLTVITALHRYERLPDRRIQVYENCANLLLEKWAKVKGTHARWRDMKMIKEDQSACVAHLGFVLHERSRTEYEDNSLMETNASTEDIASDVSTRFILKEIEHFLSSRKLMSEVTEQRAEAKRFFELMQVEAGLIVERGTGEDGEPLYGFVHRTFQEYFAAADVYEHYLQKENPKIISNFLKEHLHDPHWHEVILLLLGKLRGKPATRQLRLILDGKLKSRRSKYNDILQQDLFFVSGCLTGDVLVENDFAEIVIARLSEVAKHSPYHYQQIDALEALGSLMETRQYASLARRDLLALVTQNSRLDISVTTEAARILLRSPEGSDERQRVAQTLLGIAQSDNHIMEEKIQASVALYRYSGENTEEMQHAIQAILRIAQSAGLSVEQRINASKILHIYSNECTEEKRLAAQILLHTARSTDLSVEQRIKATEALYQFSHNSRERQFAIHMLLQMARSADLSVEQKIQAAKVLYSSSGKDSEEEQIATWILSQIAKRPDISIEQKIQAAEVLYSSSGKDSEEEQIATWILLQIAKKLDPSIEQKIQAAEVLYSSSGKDSGDKLRLLATQILLQVARSTDLSIEKNIEAAKFLYWYSHNDTEERRLASQTLLNIVQTSNFKADQRLQTATMFLNAWNSGYSEKAQAIRIILTLLPSETVKQYLDEHWYHYYRSETIAPSEIPNIVELVQQELLPIEGRDEMYYILHNMLPQFDKIPSP